MIKGYFTRFLDKITGGRYSSFVDTTKKLYSDSKELFNYVDGSLQEFAYSSPGLVGVYNDVRRAIPRTRVKARIVGRDIRTLENILFGINGTIQNTIQNYNNYSRNASNASSTTSYHSKKSQTLSSKLQQNAPVQAVNVKQTSTQSSTPMNTAAIVQPALNLSRKHRIQKNSPTMQSYDKGALNYFIE